MLIHLLADTSTPLLGCVMGGIVRSWNYSTMSLTDGLQVCACISLVGLVSNWRSEDQNLTISLHIFNRSINLPTLNIRIPLTYSYRSKYIGPATNLNFGSLVIVGLFANYDTTAAGIWTMHTGQNCYYQLVISTPKYVIIIYISGRIWLASSLYGRWWNLYSRVYALV